MEYMVGGGYWLPAKGDGDGECSVGTISATRFCPRLRYCWLPARTHGGCLQIVTSKRSSHQLSDRLRGGKADSLAGNLPANESHYVFEIYFYLFLLYENEINECGHIAHINFSVTIHITSLDWDVGTAQHLIDECGHIAHIHGTITVDIAK